MKRRVLLSLLAVGGLGLVSFFGLLWLTAPSHRIDAESYENIKKGMTENEVEGIFGVPAGDYDPPMKNERIYPVSDLFVPAVPAEAKEWKGRGLVVTIWFDDTGKVFHSQMRGRYSETFLDKVRGFLGR